MIKRFFGTIAANLGFTIVSKCWNCDCNHPIWWTSNEIFKYVTGNLIDHFCIECFDKKAKQKGLSLLWVPQVDNNIILTDKLLARLRVEPEYKITQTS